MDGEPEADGAVRAELEGADVAVETDGNREKKPGARPPTPGNCRKFARREVAKALPEIVRKFVEEAKSGSVAHAKLLASLSGLDREAIHPPRPRRTKGMVALLMERLDENEQLRQKDRGGQAVN